jgi:hypothetical protein
MKQLLVRLSASAHITLAITRLTCPLTSSNKGPTMPTTLLRTYQIKPGHWDDFLSMWREVAAIRQRFGFTIEFAFEDREKNIFTWAISHPGNLEEVHVSYYADPDRVKLKPIKEHLAAIEIRQVQPVSFAK